MSDSNLNSDRQLDNLDRLLNQALATYTPVHPRLGFEDRVRTRLADAADSTHSHARLAWYWIGTATAVCAALVLLLVVFRSSTRSFPTNPNVAQHGAQTRPSLPSAPSLPTIPTAPILKAAVPSRLSARRRVNPALQSHLTPHPTQPQPTQQQLIAQLLANNGPGAIAALAQNLARDNDKLDKPIDIQPLPDDPIVIEPIKITPIDNNPAEPGDRF